MPSAKKSFVCSSCHAKSPTWMGKCPSCGAWDTLVLKQPPKKQRSSDRAAVFAATIDDFGGDQEAIRLPEIQAPSIGRIKSGVDEFDRVLGGGLVAGSVVLVGGDPGIGKSTLMMQTAIGCHGMVLYATSEESAYQCKLRAERVSPDDASESLEHIHVLSDTDLERITAQVKEIKPTLLIVDSIQMVYRSDLDATPGSVSQIRRCCLELIYLARQLEMAVLIVGHVTKEGALAGPRVLEHLVDVVVQFEGDRHYALRALRGVKNRFGTTLEIGLFEMGEQGLQEVHDATAFLDPDAPPRSGSMVCPAFHGSRCLLVEVQALTAQGTFGQARRRANGLDGNRLTMLTAVLEQHAGIDLSSQDIYTSTVGGLRLTEPGVDLALCLAMMSAYRNITLPSEVCAIGEVGLGGEVRSVPQIEQRVAHALRRGYKKIIVPITQADILSPHCVGVASIGDLEGFIEQNSNGKTSPNRLSDEEKVEFNECA